MSTSVTYIACITQVTLEVINYTLLIYDRWLRFFYIQFLFNFPAGKHRLDGGVYFMLRSLSCSFTISTEIWSLNGKNTRTVSSVSLAGDKGRCWSQTFESTILLMVELTRCLGYVNARMLSSVNYTRLGSVTNKKINDMLDPA